MGLFHELARLLSHLRTGPNSATSYRQCRELSVSRSDWSRGVIKHLYDYIDACATVLCLVLECVNFIFIVKIRRPSTVLSRFFFLQPGLKHSV